MSDAPPMQQEPTLTTNYVRLLTDYLTARGFDLEPVLKALGIDADTLARQAHNRIPGTAFNRALDVAIEQTGDAFLGLHIGERVRPAHLGVLGYLLMSCTSARKGMELHQRWHQRFMGGAIAEYVYRPDHIWLFWRAPQAPQSVTRPGVESSLASALTFSRWLLGANANPLAMQFPHAAPDDMSEYERVFRSPMTFDAECSGMCLGASVLDTTLPQGDPEMYALMQAKTQGSAAELDLTQGEPVNRLRREIMARLPEAVPDLDSTARSLNLSSHTLKRRLAEQNTSFRKELDEVRHALALGYLKDPQLCLIDITDLLGFSEQSAFQRAFKRWTGQTPQVYRGTPY